MRTRAATEPVPARASGGNLLLGLNARQDSLERLAKLSWRDVAPTADAALRDAFVRDRILSECGALTGEPAVYLRGLLRLSLGEPKAAMTEFARLRVAEMPEDLLYAPYRLHGELWPETENPFRARLESAARHGRLSPLLEARVRGGAGEIDAALEAYLRSDPAQWKAHDVRLLSAFMAHDGHRGAAAGLLRAAFRGGRMQEPVRALAIRSLIEAGGIRRTLVADPRDREWMREGIRVQDDARKQFLAGQDAQLLANHAGREAVEASDELVVLLTLAGARGRDRVAFAKWSGELSRRTPDAEVRAWLPKLWGE